jgi:hypothetical protein
MDIADLILADHHEQRRLFAILEQIDDADTKSLTAVWRRLSTFLETHARAEELIFYPELLRVGRGAADADSAEDETRDAIKDHNEIRDAIAKVAEHPVGGEAWRKAVAEVDVANGDHMAEEERQGLGDIRRHAGLDLRHALAVRFAAFDAEHIDGVAPVDVDPKAYVQAHKH